MLGAGACWALPSCAPGLPRLNSHRGEGGSQCRLSDGLSPGWWSLRASHWHAPRLLTGGGLASGVAVLVSATPLWCAPLLLEGGRGGLVGDGGRCRDNVDCPNGGVGNSLSGNKHQAGNWEVLFFSGEQCMCVSHELFNGTPPPIMMTCGEHQKFRWGFGGRGGGEGDKDKCQ